MEKKVSLILLVLFLIIVIYTNALTMARKVAIVTGANKVILCVYNLTFRC